MKIQQNTITRIWEVAFKGKTYFVDLTYSDGQTLALCNRGYWEITDENNEEVCYAMNGEEPELSEKETDEIIKFCVENFFTGKFKEEIQEAFDRA